MQAMQPYIAVTDGYAKGGQNFIYQVPIPDSDWTFDWSGFTWRTSDAAVATSCTFHWSRITSFDHVFDRDRLCSAFVDQTLTRPSDYHFEDWSRRCSREGCSQRISRIVALAQAFNAMLDQIDNLMQQVKEEEQNARRYELRALSAQINPHFLYNTLDTIVWMAEFNDSRRVVDITKSLAQYFRLALTKARNKSTERWNRPCPPVSFHSKTTLWWKAQLWNSRRWTVGRLSASEISASALSEKMRFTMALKRSIGQVSFEWQLKSVETTPAYRFFDNGRGFDRSGSTAQTLLRLGGVGLKKWTNDCIFNLAKPIIWRLILRQIAIPKLPFFLPLAPAMNIHRGWDKSSSLNYFFGLSSKTQWLSGLYTLISSAFLQPLLNCAEVGRRNRIVTSYRFLSTLFCSQRNFDSFLVKSDASHQIYDKIKVLQ